MAITNLNTVLRGIVASLPTKSVDNNYLLDSKGKTLKSTGRDICLWNDELYHSPLDSFFVFNPFHELATHEDSPSLSYLRRMLNQELNTVLMTAIPAIFSAAIKIKTPNKRQSKIITSELGDSCEAVLKFLNKLNGEIKLNHRSRSIVDLVLYTSHPVTRDADGLKYAGMKSPLYADLSYWVPGGKIFGTGGATKAVVGALRQVIRSLLPEDFEGGLYFVGNKHSTIPRNKALHDIYSDVLDHINDVLATLKISDVNVPVIHEDWTNGLSSVYTLIQGIPRDVFGTIGAVRAGSSASPEDEPRIVIQEGFGSAPTPMLGGTVPNGGLMGSMVGNQVGTNGLMGGMVAPAGYMLVQVQPQMSVGFPNMTLNGQTATPVATPTLANVPPGGLMGGSM